MMKQQEILKKIGVILRELDEQYDYIQQTPGIINDLELELFVANGHFLSDHIEILRKINSQLAKQDAEAKPPVTLPYVAPPVQYTPPLVAPINLDLPVVQYTPAPPIAELTDTAKETYTLPDLIQKALPEPDPYREPREDEPLIKYELNIDDLPEDDEDEEEVWDEDAILKGIQEIETPQPPVEKSFHFSLPVTPPVEPAYVPYVAPEPEYTAEPGFIPYVAPEPEYIPYVATEPVYQASEPVYYAPESAPVTKPITEPEQKLTVNQMLSAQMAGSRVHEQLTPIKDLKSAITLNDKLLFVKDLFNNYSLSYSEALEILNRYSSFADADEFLKHNYATKNNWADKPATVEKFYALLRRRFA